MCHNCIQNANTSGYLTNAPCGEPIFVDYPTYKPCSCFNCQPDNPWVNDLFTYKKFPHVNIDYLDECPCKYTGPLIG